MTNPIDEIEEVGTAKDALSASRQSFDLFSCSQTVSGQEKGMIFRRGEPYILLALARKLPESS